MQKQCNIISNEQIAKNTYSLWLDAGEVAQAAKPGQFVHVQCGADTLLRRPISICDVHENRLRIVFHTVGKGTKWLAEQTSGSIDLLGPLGNGFNVSGKHLLLLGGGIGAPPMLYVARKVTGKVTALLGFRSKEHVILQEEFADLCDQVYTYTDDGSFGNHGYATDTLDGLLKSGWYDGVLACGPLPMLSSIADIAKANKVPCQVSLEEHMACGVGACLGCVTDFAGWDGFCVCKAGPVMAVDS